MSIEKSSDGRLSVRKRRAFRRGRFIGVGALLGVLLLVASAVGARRSPFEPLSIFARALAHLETAYIEPIDQNELVYGAIRGMIGTLDPHTTFLDPEEYRILEDDTSGRFAGIGVEVSMRDGWLTVLSVFEDGPAFDQGLKPGDRFLQIDGKDARDLRLSEAVRRMRGKAGSTVRVSMRRPGADDAISATLTRAYIDLEPVEIEPFDDGIVYVQLKAFQEQTASMLSDGLDRAAVRLRDTGGVRGILLDMRNNGGGLLRQAVLVTDEFLSSGVIVSTRGRNDVLRRSFKAHRGGTRPNWPMVVLVNAQTASAAEIVAGALQDHKRGIVVGERSFGKGSVQNIIALPDGSAMKVTVSKYFTPDGTSIQAQGISPDIEVVSESESKQSEAEVLREESLPGHLPAQPDKKKTMQEIPKIKWSVKEKGVPKSLLDDRQASVGYRALKMKIRERK